MRIVTTLTHNDKGRPQIVAKGGGKQKTISYDHAKGHDASHGEAAGTLLVEKFPTLVADALHDLDHGTVAHHTETGARHRFVFPNF